MCPLPSGRYRQVNEGGMARVFQRLGGAGFPVSWRVLGVGVTAGTLLAGAALLSSRQAATPRPNILLIYIDDLGWSDLSIQGSRYYETPNIDRLARMGMRFTSGYANAPNCAPSRASLLSGQYTPRHGVYTVNDPWRGPKESRRLKPPANRRSLDLQVYTLAEALLDAGYITAHLGKWHLGSPGVAGPKEQGFDLNLGGTQAGHPLSYFSPYGIETLRDGPPGEYLTDRLTEEALRFIETQRERPFFLYLSHYAVHTPLQAKPSSIERYRRKPPWHGQSNATYAAMIESVDQSVARIVNWLEKLKILDRTIILFSSDNGGLGGYLSTGLPPGRAATDNYPLKGGKGQLYEGGIRVPTFIVWPGVVPQESVSAVPVLGIDFYPTVLEMAGVAPRREQILDGESLVPLLRRQGRLQREAVFWFFPAYLEAYQGQGIRTGPAAAIRQGDEKLIWFFEDDRLELYDLDDDLGEKHNLAEKHPERAAALQQRLKEWMKEVGAFIPGPNPHYRLPFQGEREGKVWEERVFWPGVRVGPSSRGPVGGLVP